LISSSQIQLQHPQHEFNPLALRSSAEKKYVGFEVFTAVTMKNAIFWGVAPCRCGRLNRLFGGSYCLHLQGRKIRERRISVSSHTPEDGILQRKNTLELGLFLEK
jgi:hypothetical protein